MADNPIFVEPDEELPGVIDRIKRAPTEEAAVVLPIRSRFGQSRFNFQLLRQYGVRLGKRVTIICPDPTVQRMAQENGLSSVATVDQYVPGQASSPAEEQQVSVPYEPPLAEVLASEPVYAQAATEAPPSYVEPSAPAPPAGTLDWNPQIDPDPAPTIETGVDPWAAPTSSPPPPAAWSPYDVHAPTEPPPELGRPRFTPGADRDGRLMPPRPARRAPSTKMRLSIPTYLAPLEAKPGLLVLYAGAALLLLVGLVGSIVYMPSAEVDMVAQAQPFSSNVSVSGDPGRHPIPIRVARASRSATQTFTASMKVTPAQAAKGSATFDASSCSVGFQIPNGTRLRGPGGIEFATSGGDISLGGGGNPAQATATITATQAGQPGNVEAGPYVFENPNGADCIVISGTQTGGGTNQQQKQQVQKGDVDNAQKALEQNLQQQLTDEFSKGTHGGEKLAVEQIQWKPSLSTPGHQVGDDVSNFSASLTEDATAYYYRPGDVRRAIANSLKPTIPAGKQIAGDLTTDYQVTANQSGHLTFAGKASGFLAPRLNSGAIRAQVAGRSPSEVTRTLKSRYPVRDVQVKQYPFGLPFMPLSASRVTVRYQILSP